MVLQCHNCGAYLFSETATSCHECHTPIATTTPSANSNAAKSRRPAPSPAADTTTTTTTTTTGQPRRFQDAKLDTRTQKTITASELEADFLVKGLSRMYKDILLPLEKEFRFPTFATPSLHPIDFQTPPQCLLIGGYSTGKTSFINYLVERDIIGTRIAAEPSTDKFCAIMGVNSHQPTEKVILGSAAASDPSLPFQQLQTYGTSFLNRFQVSTCNSPILNKITFIDTPGLLSDKDKALSRDYNYPQIVRQFAHTSSCILLLFDAHKIDISDELGDVIKELRGHEDKVHIILNKADQLSSQELMRVFGSTLWGLSRIFTSPECVRVYPGSFWSKPLLENENKALFESEEAELLSTLRSLPKNHSIRLINDIVKRARQVRTHVLIINQLKSNFGFFSRNKTVQTELTQEDRLVEEFKKVQVAHDIPINDFPKMTPFLEKIKMMEIHKFPDLDKKKIEKLDWMLAQGIPNLIQQGQDIRAKEIEREQIQQQLEQQQQQQHILESGGSVETNPAPPGYVDEGYGGYGGNFNPFDDGDDQDLPNDPWAIPNHLQLTFRDEFNTLKLVNSQVSGSNAKHVLLAHAGGSAGVVTGKHLKAIWAMADLDKNGSLDVDEFILCCYLIKLTKESGGNLPTLTLEMCSPPKRHLFKPQQ